MTAFLTSNSNIPESSQQSIGMSKSYKDSLVRYFLKWKGQDSGPTDSRPTQPTFQTTCTSTLITFISLVITAYVNQSTEFINGPLTETGSLLIGSLGATAVLLYHAIDSPLAQPSNLFWGHLISAFIGVSTSKVFDLEALHPHKLTLAVPVGVALAIFAMGLTNTMHPPGGATAFLAISGSAEIQRLGYGYMVRPVLTCVTTMFICALVFNNLDPGRRYPKYWTSKLTYFARKAE